MNQDSTHRDGENKNGVNSYSAEQNNANQKYQRQLLVKIFQVEPKPDFENTPLEFEKLHPHNANKANAADASSRLVTQTALNVYINNFNENGIRALSITFPTVEGFVGEHSFRMLARRYLKYETKTSFDWAHYGSQLPSFIADQEALAEYPFLSEVAELDWAIHHAQREADKAFEASSLALLENGDTSVLRFIPAPGLQVLKFWFPVLDLYRLIHEPLLKSAEGKLARQALLTDIKISISNAVDILSNSVRNNAINNATPRFLILWRPEYKAQFEYVTKAEAAVMQKLSEQASVDAIIDSIGAHNLDLTAWLSKAISNKFIFSVAWVCF